MNRSKFGMTSLRSYIALVATLNIIALTNAGPLGPLPMQNVTSADMGIKEGNCALGDVVYMWGDEFPGSSPCERCVCAQGGVRCARQQCAPRPGCKALHRPDHCCPTYQCECEQEGRVYGNGEKLVDPQDPCRVCYCQGGEVVCRRIACFVRDDCTPRLVPGRCCPEYDNCPLRGVTALPGMTSPRPTILASSSEPSAIPAVPKEIIEPKITIKEITPVSEIPVITDVKIKEILPSPSIEVAEYSSSKSPLITREATSEKSSNLDVEIPKLAQEVPSVVEVHSSPETVSTEESKPLTDNKNQETPAPSKISLSTQDSINSEIYPSIVPIIATMGSPSITPDTRPAVITTKAPMVEEEDITSLFDLNPAFPPLPDDFSVLSNHGEEIVPEPSADTDHMPVERPTVSEIIVPSITSTNVADVIEPLTTTTKYISDASVSTSEDPTELSTSVTELTSTSAPTDKENPTIKLRSAIPTEIINASSDQEIARDSNEKVSIQTSIPIDFITTDVSEMSEEITTEEPETPIERVSFLTTGAEPEIQTITQKFTESPANEGSSTTSQDQTTNSIAKSNIATEVTSQTELSSLPIETSDQNPHEASENVSKETLDISTADPLSDAITTTDKTPAASSEVGTFPKADSRAIENIETTEFILTSFGSSESSTDGVEIIKIPGDSDKNAAIIDGTDGNKNALTDLIKLVSDVASMSDHTDAPQVVHQASSTSYSNSEELIPVNAGYKSKNSNFNQNSITEVPFKSKSATPPNKQKIVEIDEDEDESAGITDSPAPDDRAEPTTRRPLIDNVSDDMAEVKSDKKDIEIITQSYVPTINRRPTKVIKEDENDMRQDEAPVAASAEAGTEGAPARGSAELAGAPSAEQ